MKKQIIINFCEECPFLVYINNKDVYKCKRSNKILFTRQERIGKDLDIDKDCTLEDKNPEKVDYWEYLNNIENFQELGALAFNLNFRINIMLNRRERGIIAF